MLTQLDLRSRVRAVEAPVPARGGEPARSGLPGLTLLIARVGRELVLDRQRQEAADGPLAALVVGVEQLGVAVRSRPANRIRPGRSRVWRKNEPGRRLR